MLKPNKNVNRRIEFLETAEALFNEKGFEKTSIDDIVERMGVAKGLFYYYFNSKEELLTILMDRLIDEIQSSVTAVMEKKGLTALQRYRELIMASADVTSRAKTLIAYFHQERNQSIHLTMEKRSREFMIPVMERIIEQGNEEGVFHADHAHETAVAMLAMLSGVRHAHPLPENSSEMVEVIIALQDLSERLLVMEKGTFRLFEEMLPPDLNRSVDRKRKSRRMR